MLRKEYSALKVWLQNTVNCPVGLPIENQILGRPGTW